MKRSYRQTYHANVPSGWANDPNGTIFYRGRAHLFFQHYPYKPEWGTMHWGHFATDDFVRWETLPLALEPDREYEALCGCCSGSAIAQDDGRLFLLYTAAQPDRQRQCAAVSDDGVHFTKNPDNPILTAEMLHGEVNTEDFRDPRLFRKGDMYYAIAGVRIVDLTQSLPNGHRRASGENPDRPVRSPSIGDVSGTDPEKEGYGNLILIKSPDLLHWSYVGKLLYPQEEYSPEYYRLNGVYECPDYFAADDGTEILLSSPQNLPPMGLRYQNIHSTVYMTGALDFETGRFTVDAIEELDSGFDFYAAQTLRMPDGRVILIAWKEMWDRSYPTQAEGWAGTYTLPRELTVENRKVIQKPVREMERYRQGRVYVPGARADEETLTFDGIAGNTIELSFTLEPGAASRAGVKLFQGTEHETLVYYDRGKGVLVFDRSRAGIPLRGREADVQRRYCALEHADSIELRLFLDVSSLEVFINGGRHTMTGNVFPDPEDTGVVFFSEGGACRFREIEKYDIVVPPLPEIL